MPDIIYRLIEEKDQYFIEGCLGEKGALALSALVPYARDKDRPVLKIFELHQKKYGKRMHRFAVAGTAGAEMLRTVAQTGNLFFHDKKIVFDPFTKLDLVLTARPLSDERIEITGALQGPTQNTPLSRCQAVFPGIPPCVLTGLLLQNLRQDIDSHFLLLAFRQPYICSKQELERLIEELKEEGEEAPELLITTDSLLESVPLEEETRPILKLRDRFGAFADLWIAYSRNGEVAFHDSSLFHWRKRSEEKGWEKDLLKTGFQEKPAGTSHYYCPMDKVVRSLTFLLEIGWKILDYQGREVLRQGEAAVDIGHKGAYLHFKGSLRYGQHNADVKDIVGAFNRRERFIELSPGHVGLMDTEINPLSELSEDVQIDEEGLLLGKQKMGIGLDFSQYQGFVPREDVRTLLQGLSGNDLSLHMIVPATRFSGVLHPYQQEGLNWLSILYENQLGGLLADEMGLGKTVQVMALLSRVVEENSMHAPIIIIAPTSLLFHWRKEFEKFLPSVAIYTHSGPERIRDQKELEEHRVILTSYTLLRLDHVLFSGITFAAIILDEAQTIKNPLSQIAESVSRLQATFRLAITGTPIENRHQDIWSIFHFLLPGLLEDRAAFQAKMLAGESDPRFFKRLRQLIRPFILRRRKDLVAAQLPAKIEQVIWVEMEERQRAFYEEKLRSYKQGFVQKIREETISKYKMEVLEAILRLRQICCHPQLVEASASLESAKMNKLLEDLESIVAEGRKALIYSQFTSMLHIIEKEVRSRGWGYVVLEGATRNREEVVQKFQEDPNTSLFLLSLKAGGVGLNLTAADYVLLYDPWWNDAVEKQAIDRAHRLGRKGQVIARRYVLALSIEEKIMRLKELKSGLADQIFDEEMGAKDWKIDDLLELLQA